MQLYHWLLNWTVLAVLTAATDRCDFDAREATITSIQQQLNEGRTTCRYVVESFLSRIEALNENINAIITLNPDALNAADQIDRHLALNCSPDPHKPLRCVPILLKDNYDTDNVPTTGGSLALARSQPSVNAPVVDAIERAGAIVLGKANLHELALEGLSVSSLGGQTINPYDFSRTPGGSSGGTGAAVAASLAVWGTGTDTVNSLRSPASANCVFSCRPTRGLISRTGVIPISYTQDVVGPIARSVEDVAIALTVMASTRRDPRDNATALAPKRVRGTDYAANLRHGSLAGMRIGLLEGFVNASSTDSEVVPVNEAMANMTKVLQKAGATVVPITNSLYNATALSAKYDVQRYEWREGMNAYLQDPSLKGVHPETLQQLYSGHDYLVIPSQYAFVNTSLESSTSNATYHTALAGIASLKSALSNTFSSNNLSAIIYPEQRNLVVPIGSPSQTGRNGILAALTGYPVVAMPAGFSAPSDSAPLGVPIGMEILGQPWSEKILLQIAYQIDELTKLRVPPVWASEAVEVRSYDRVPVVKPNATVPPEYPVGVLY